MRQWRPLGREGAMVSTSKIRRPSLVFINKLSYWLNKISGYFLVFCFSLMTVTYFGQVLLRYVFQTGLHWTEELTRYTNIAMVMVGSAMLAGQHKHINVSALEMMIPEAHRKYLYIFQQLLSLTFFGVVVKISLDMISLAGTQVSTNMRVPMAYVYSIFTVAFAISVFQVIVFILNLLMKREVQ
jgi:TRAP-type C4-dicarboxylate transport system permease small subunit